MDSSPGLASAGVTSHPFWIRDPVAASTKQEWLLCGGVSTAVESRNLGPCPIAALDVSITHTQHLGPRWERTHQGGPGSAKA